MITPEQIRRATREMYRALPANEPIFIYGETESLEAIAGGAAAPGKTPIYRIRFGYRERNARKRERRARRGK